MPGEHRKHTPLVSSKQRRLFGVWMSKPSERPSSITKQEVEDHMHESGGKKLPESTTPMMKWKSLNKKKRSRAKGK